MALAAWLGATAARGEESVVVALDEFGMRLGRGLQMINDLAELNATAEQRGRCDDIRNRRVTWPWAWLAQIAATDEYRRLQLDTIGDSYRDGPATIGRNACCGVSRPKAEP